MKYPERCAACERKDPSVYPYACHRWEPLDVHGRLDEDCRRKPHYVCEPCRLMLLQMEPTGVIKCGQHRRLCPDEMTDDQRLLVAIGSQP